MRKIGADWLIANLFSSKMALGAPASPTPRCRTHPNAGLSAAVSNAEINVKVAQELGTKIRGQIRTMTSQVPLACESPGRFSLDRVLQDLPMANFKPFVFIYIATHFECSDSTHHLSTRSN